MSLKIYCGSRIENLAEKLKERLLKDRQGKDPFLFSKVVVPNVNVAKWLQIRMFAKEPDLCAGIQFPFMEKELTELMLAGLSPKDRVEVELLPDHAYAKAIVSILLADPKEQPEHDKLAPFRSYIMNSDDSADEVAITEQKQAAMTWQLADKLADLMDSYEVYRPEIVEAWLGTQECSYDLPKGTTAEAEAALARALWGTNGKFKQDGRCLSLRQLYNRVKNNVLGETAKTIYFFGQSTLSVLQAQILVWLAKTHNVMVFYRNPCHEFWGDIETKNEERKALFRVGRHSGDDPEKEYGGICENELLKMLGIAGRETLRLLVDLEESAERIGFDWESLDDEEAAVETVLGKVQESIRCRTSEVAKCRQDASVQIVGTPGVRREVEMVYNSILGSVARPDGVKGDRPWEDCSFSDIAVIVPDMQTYRPVIEAVFDARGEVPYGLLDTSASDDSNYLRGFLSLIELGRRGLNRERLFNVLENPCVQRALGFAREDVVKWRELTEKIGAFDGFEHDDDSGYFDWSSALKRLRLARLANKVSDENGNDLPLVNDGGEEALKFSEVVELLYRDLADTLFDEKGMPRALPLVADRGEDGTRADCWAERLARLAKSYLAVDKDEMLESKVSQSVIGTLYSLVGISGEQSFELAASAVEHFVGGIPCRKGGFLTSGVTIGGFSSLSAIPFKQVYMMGMGAGGFPGRASDSTLDVRGTGWRLGDVSIPNRNRFLFLESIMSVRDRLIFSYPNKDIEKDAELFPSGIVREVEKFIGKHVLDYDEQTKEKEKKFQEFRDYPLLERGEAGLRKEGEKRPTDDIVWVANDPFAGLLPTYSTAARKLARARAEGKGAKPEVKAVTEEGSKQRVELSAKVLAEFLKNPVRAVMRHRFGISVAGYLETDLDPDSPLGSLDGPDKWNLQAKWLDPDASGEVEKEIRRLQLAGKMPMGFLGEYAKSAIMQKAGESLGAIKDLIAGFALSDGKDNMLHLDHAADFGTGGTDELKIRFVAEVANWKEECDEVSVLVTGWLGKNVPKLPTESCFDAFLAYLMAVFSGKCMAQRLKVGVVDLTNGTTGAWTWSGINADRAGKYLERLARSFLTYELVEENGRAVAPRPPQTARGAVPTEVMAGERKMVDFTSKKLLEALNKYNPPYLWSDILEKVTTEDHDNSSHSFNNDLVLEQNLERFKREPGRGEELEEIYKERYQLPLSGIRVETVEEEANHE